MAGKGNSSVPLKALVFKYREGGTRIKDSLLGPKRTGSEKRGHG